MALVKCSYCGHMVSKNALTCPNCHRSLLKGVLASKWGIAFSISCILLLVLNIINFIIWDLNFFIDDYEIIDKLHEIRRFFTDTTASFIMRLLYYLGDFILVYVISMTFKSKSTRMISISLCIVSKLLNEIYIWYEKQEALFIVIFIMCVVTYIIIIKETQGELRCVFIILLLSYAINILYIIMDLTHVELEFSTIKLLQSSRDVVTIVADIWLLCLAIKYVFAKK